MGHLRLCKVKTFSSGARFFYTEINITYALTIKKETKHFVSCSQSPTFAPVFWSYVLRPPDFGVWCNGNTADSGPAFPGSSPGTPTRTQSLTALRFTSQRSFFDVLGRKSLKSQTNPTQPRNRLFRCVGFSFSRCTIRK